MEVNSQSSIVWFRHDLRLEDNPALIQATRHAGPVLPVFIWSPEEEGEWAPGAASRYWLHQSLRALDGELRARQSRLIIRRGPVLATLRTLCLETGTRTICWNRRYEPMAVTLDEQIERELNKDAIKVRTFNANLLYEPNDIQTKQGSAFQVFTAFWKACTSTSEPAPPDPSPKFVKCPSQWPSSLQIGQLGLEPRVDWAGGIRDTWTPGEAGASLKLDSFLQNTITDYTEFRDLPDKIGTSRLSPHLHFGEISPRRIWHAVHEVVVANARTGVVRGAEKFLGELGWREFAHHLIVHFPRTMDEPLREPFQRFPWVEDLEALKAWQTGRTGYPIVDAGMRELWSTGWMHNRVRMIVASFLTKDLLISWEHGARWFWDTLVDADLANNTLGWQWSAGCGADAAPYFRVFNPVTQGSKFDPDGAYVRRWIPELAGLSNGWIHRPWEAPASTRREAGVTLGVTYPQPIVDHATARQRALEAFASIKQQ